MSAPADNSMDPAGPCKGLACKAAIGCVSAVGVPLSPASLPIPVAWTAITFSAAVSMLAGQVIDPELHPPILTP